MSVTLEGDSLALDREAAVAALERLGPLLQRLPDKPSPADLARELPETTGDLAEEAIDEWDDGDGSINFVQALLIAQILSSELKSFSHEGDLVVETEEAQAAICHGSLSVSGGLDLDAHLITLGDLRVEGRVRDLVPWTRLIVTGNLRCRTIWSGSPIWVSGSIDADVVYLSHHGAIWCGDGLQAKLVIASPDARGITGEVRSQHYSPVEDWQDDARGALTRLEGILVPEAFRGTDRESGFFQPEDLLRLVEDGRPYLRKEGAEP